MRRGLRSVSRLAWAQRASAQASASAAAAPGGAPSFGGVAAAADRPPRRAYEAPELPTRVVHAETLSHATSWDNYTFSPRVVALANELMSLNQVEMLELTKFMQRRMGLSDELLFGGGFGQVPVMQTASGGAGAAPSAAGAAAAPADGKAGAAPAAAEAKESATVKLTITAIDEGGKIKVMKEIRTLKPDLKLMDVKALVDKLPSQLLDSIEREKAADIVKKFKEAGATVTMT